MLVAQVQQEQVGGGLLLTPNSARIGNSSLHKIPCAEAVNGKQVDLYGPLGPCHTALVLNDLFVYQCCLRVLRYSIHVHTFRSLIVDSY